MVFVIRVQRIEQGRCKFTAPLLVLVITVSLKTATLDLADDVTVDFRLSGLVHLE